jgi:hypothetical protein
LRKPERAIERERERDRGGGEARKGKRSEGAMADDSGTVGMAIGTAVGGTSIALFTGVSCWLGMKAYRDGRFSRGWWRMRVCTLGGVTTLGQALAYDCAMCGRSLDQREEVRTLSCGHVFHLRKGPKCMSNIDDWLRENRMRCPSCCKPVYPVLPWKAPTTSVPPTAPVPLPAQSSTSTSTSDLEAQEPRRWASSEQGPQRRLSLDLGRPRYPPSI